MLPVETVLNIHGLWYKQIITSNFQIGDLVIDTRDDLYGVCESIFEGYMAVRDKDIVEIGIPIEKVRKLTPTIAGNNSLN